MIYTMWKLSAKSSATKQMTMFTLQLSPEFASASGLLKELIATRSNRNERLERADVYDAAETIGRYIEQDSAPSLRLEAASLLGKVSETFNSKALTAKVTAQLCLRLSKPLPPVGAWGNADDRKYLAKAISASKAEWIPRYAAESLAQSEINEIVSRDIWAELAVARARDLSSVLQTVAQAATLWLSTRGNSSELTYRKLRRICDALAQTLLIADVPSGLEFGAAFTALIRIAGGGKGAETIKAREEAAISVLDLLIQILRLRFDVLFDSDIYRAVGTVRRWWQPARPPDEVERRSDRIVGLAMKGLHILARQGVQDKELRHALSQSMDAARVNAAGQALADVDISLDPKSSKFLATGLDPADTRSSAAILEINELATDELIGHLLLSMANQDVSVDALISAANALDLFEPAQASVVRRAGGRLQIVQQSLDALGSKRRLSTYAARGEIVRYDPAIHDTSEILQRLSEVRISVPGIAKIIDGRSPSIIIKALVEKL